MKNYYLVTLMMMVMIPTMTCADEKELSNRSIASVSVKNELTISQEKRKKDLNEKIEKIILSEVIFKN